MKFSDPYVDALLGEDYQRTPGWLWVRGQFPAQGARPAHSPIGGAVVGPSFRFGYEGNEDLLVTGELIFRPTQVLATDRFAGYRMDQLMTLPLPVDGKVILG